MSDGLVRWWPVNAHEPPEHITLIDGRKGVFIPDDRRTYEACGMDKTLPQTVELPDPIKVTV